MTIRAQVGELPDKIRWFARHGEHMAITGNRGSPELKLARMLVKAGFDQAEPYETARGNVVAMRFKSLSAAAELTVVEPKDGKTSPRIVEWQPFMRGASASALDEDSQEE